MTKQSKTGTFRDAWERANTEGPDMRRVREIHKQLVKEFGEEGLPEWDAYAEKRAKAQAEGLISCAPTGTWQRAWRLAVAELEA